MTAASYAAVDWGTSSFRLWIVSESGASSDRAPQRRRHDDRREDRLFRHP